ncbi:MAG: hypothetical protein ABI540_08125 [Spartobacteria bacterium]
MSGDSTNSDTGHIRHAVFNTSDKKVSVPWSALIAKNTESGQTPHFAANTTKQKMANATKFDSNNISNLSNRTAEEPILTCYELIWFPDIQTPDEQTLRHRDSLRQHDSKRRKHSCHHDADHWFYS